MDISKTRRALEDLLDTLEDFAKEIADIKKRLDALEKQPPRTFVDARSRVGFRPTINGHV